MGFNLNKVVSKQWFLQTLFIIFAVLVSIFTITWILEKSLVKQALELEADAFISHYKLDDTFPLPRTRNLIGYLSNSNPPPLLPPEIKDLSPGLYPKMKISGRASPVPVYVRDFDNNRLYLIFEGANIDRLVGVFGLIPVSILLILIYTSSWIAYKLTWRVASPVLSLARNLRNSEPDNFSLDVSTKNLSGDTKELAEALEEYAKRIDVFVERERQFTADISHELRTPMTIIDGAAQFLQTEKSISDKGLDRVKMIRRACRDMNDFSSAFFLLAREQNSTNENDSPNRTNVAELIEHEVIKHDSLIDNTKVKLSIDIQNELIVDTHKKALEIIFANILGNAIKYTESGSIAITLKANQVLVSDTGIGIPEELLPKLFERHIRGRGLNQAGEGIGLAIVKRLCDQFNWDISIQNQVDAGIQVTLTKCDRPEESGIIIRTE